MIRCGREREGECSQDEWQDLSGLNTPLRASGVVGRLRLPLGATSLDSIKSHPCLECVGIKNVEDIDPTFQESVEGF